MLMETLRESKGQYLRLERITADYYLKLEGLILDVSISSEGTIYVKIQSENAKVLTRVRWEDVLWISEKPLKPGTLVYEKTPTK